MSFPVSQERFFVLRAAASYLYYDFPEAQGTTEVRSPGASATLAYRVRTPRLTATIGPGYEFRRSKRRLSGGEEVEETERGLTAQAEIFFQATPLLNWNAILSYGGANQYLWARGGVKRQVTNTSFERPTAVSIGLEATGQGNEDVRSYQLGGLLEVAFLRLKGSLQFRGGYSLLEYPDGSRENRLYLGSGFYRAF